MKSKNDFKAKELRELDTDLKKIESNLNLVYLFVLSLLLIAYLTSLTKLENIYLLIGFCVIFIMYGLNQSRKLNKLKSNLQRVKRHIEKI